MPVVWSDQLGGWLVRSRALALRVMRDPVTFTVDDPRFSTAQVVGRSMLSTEDAEHERHRAPFARRFRLNDVRRDFSGFVAEEAGRLLDALAARGEADLRREYAGPIAVAVVTRALGLPLPDSAQVLTWYDAIVAATAGVATSRPVSPEARAAVAELAAAVAPSLGEDAVPDAAVIMFGGIETTEGMIANALFHLLSHPDQRALVEADPALLPNAIEESLRLQPAVALIDRYATADDDLAGVPVRAGDLVSISVTDANRDPEFFEDPLRFDVRRRNAKLHVAFAHGPHVCLGMHLARLEAHAALAAALERLPGLRLDPDHDATPRGLVFVKPAALRVLWG